MPIWTDVEVKQIVNSFLQSNTFVLSLDGENDVYLIDIGDIEPVVNLIGGKNVRGVFLTHAHFDHVYGINNLIRFFPKCTIYGSGKTLNALKDDKLNFSYYYETPLSYKQHNECEVRSEDIILLWDKIPINVLPTPGHSPGSTSYIVDNVIFTGDAYIPNIATVTKLKGGDKWAADNSVEIIKKHIREKSLLCPGHLCQYTLENGVLKQIET